MSVTGKNNLSIRKKDVQESKSLSIGYKKLVFAHEAQAGDTGIDLTALTTPTSMASKGFTNPSSTDITSAKLYFYRKNLKLVSSLRGELVDFLSYDVASSTRINFQGFTAQAGEIFIGTIDHQPTTGLQIVDGKPAISTGILPAGQTDFSVGTPFEVNKYPGAQIGAVMVYVDGLLQFRNSGNSSTVTDGNYYEVDAGSGLGNLIRFNNSFAVDKNIVVVSNGPLIERPTASQQAEIESLAGQVDKMIPTLAQLAGVPETDFQAGPNYVDLKAFSDRVINLEDKRVIKSISGGFVSYTAPALAWGDLTSIALPEGEWDIVGLAEISMGGSGTPTNFIMGISSISGNDATGLVNGDNVSSVYLSTTTSNVRFSTSIPSYSVTVPAGTSKVMYLKSYIGASIAFTVAYRISARRIK